MSTQPKVSVVIPTYERERCIIDLLNCLFVQDYPHFEVLVIDQSASLSSEKEEIIRAGDKRLKYYKIGERGRSIAKNYGITMATGDIILFCDDDITVGTNFISTHVGTFTDPTVGAQSCRLVEEGQPAVAIHKPLRTTFFGQLINKPYSTESGFVTSLNGGNMSFRRDVLTQVGYFDEFFAGTSMVEEPDIAYRVIQSGFKIYFNAAITVQHFPQHNGNIAMAAKKRQDWFYFYFYNLCIFYMKYRRFWNMPFVFVYCIVLSLKHTVIFRLGLKAYFRMVSGYLDGTTRGLKISKLPSPGKYHTPIRLEKKKYAPLSATALV